MRRWIFLDPHRPKCVSLGRACSSQAGIKGAWREGAGEAVPAMLGGKGSGVEVWNCRNLGGVGVV